MLLVRTLLLFARADDATEDDRVDEVATFELRDDDATFELRVDDATFELRVADATFELRVDDATFELRVADATFELRVAAVFLLPYVRLLEKPDVRSAPRVCELAALRAVTTLVLRISRALVIPLLR